MASKNVNLLAHWALALLWGTAGLVHNLTALEGKVGVTFYGRMGSDGKLSSLPLGWDKLAVARGMQRQITIYGGRGDHNFVAHMALHALKAHDHKLSCMMIQMPWSAKAADKATAWAPDPIPSHLIPELAAMAGHRASKSVGVALGPLSYDGKQRPAGLTSVEHRSWRLGCDEPALQEALYLGFLFSPLSQSGARARHRRLRCRGRGHSASRSQSADHARQGLF